MYGFAGTRIDNHVRPTICVIYYELAANNRTVRRPRHSAPSATRVISRIKRVPTTLTSRPFHTSVIYLFIKSSLLRTSRRPDDDDYAIVLSSRDSRFQQPFSRVLFPRDFWSLSSGFCLPRTCRLDGRRAHTLTRARAYTRRDAYT